MEPIVKNVDRIEGKRRKTLKPGNKKQTFDSEYIDERG